MSALGWVAFTTIHFPKSEESNGAGLAVLLLVFVIIDVVQTIKRYLQNRRERIAEAKSKAKYWKEYEDHWKQFGK
jgi:type III secretory pathway component EscR